MEEVRPILEGIPGGVIHDGGRLRVGPDKRLYITSGDAGNAESAQERRSLAGTILRLELDGSVPEDNPFPDSPVFSWGHRNPQGLDWSDDGGLYAAEQGPSGTPAGHDESNRMEPGKNYGWPGGSRPNPQGMEKPCSTPDRIPEHPRVGRLRRQNLRGLPAGIGPLDL